MPKLSVRQVAQRTAILWRLSDRLGRLSSEDLLDRAVQAWRVAPHWSSSRPPAYDDEDYRAMGRSLEVLVRRQYLIDDRGIVRCVEAP